MKTLVNWLQATDSFNVRGRGMVYTGPAPFDIDKTDKNWQDRFLKMPWVISHPDIPKDTMWQCVGVETWAIAFIAQGSPIGLLIRPWPIDN